MEWVNRFFSAVPPHEEVGPSQLGGAPPATQDSTQLQQTSLPEQGRRSTRETIPPEPLTYSQHHKRAAQAAERHGRRRGAGADASSVEVLACYGLGMYVPPM